MLQHPDSCHALSKPPVSCAIRTAARRAGRLPFLLIEKSCVLIVGSLFEFCHAAFKVRLWNESAGFLEGG